MNRKFFEEKGKKKGNNEEKGQVTSTVSKRSEVEVDKHADAAAKAKEERKKKSEEFQREEISPEERKLRGKKNDLPIDEISSILGEKVDHLAQKERLPYCTDNFFAICF